MTSSPFRLRVCNAIRVDKRSSGGKVGHLESGLVCPAKPVSRLLEREQRCPVRGEINPNRKGVSGNGRV